MSLVFEAHLFPSRQFSSMKAKAEAEGPRPLEGLMGSGWHNSRSAECAQEDGLWSPDLRLGPSEAVRVKAAYE